MGFSLYLSLPKQNQANESIEISFFSSPLHDQNIKIQNLILTNYGDRSSKVSDVIM